MYPNLFYSSLKTSCLRNVKNFIDVPRGFNFIKTVYELVSMQILIYHVQYYREGYDVYFPNCVKNERVQALSDSVKLSRRLTQKNLVRTF